MSKTILFSYIISIGGLLHAFASIFSMERKNDILDKKEDKFFKIIQKSLIRFFGATNQMISLLVIGLAIYFAGSKLEIKNAGALVFGVIVAFFAGKMAVKLLDASSRRSKNAEAIATTNSTLNITMISLAVLTTALAYQMTNSVQIIIPFIFGIFLVSAILHSAGNVFLQTTEKTVSGSIRIISKIAMYVFAEPMEFLGNFLFAPVSAAILGLYFTGVNGRAVFLPLVLTLFAAVFIIIELFVLKFLKQDQYKRFFQRYFWGFSVAMLLVSFFVVKKLIGIDKIFWMFALGIALAAILKIFENKTNSVITRNILLAFIFIVIAWAFRINEAYAAAITGLGAVLVLSGSYIEVAFFNFLENSSSGINLMEVNFLEKRDSIEAEKLSKKSFVMSEISLISFVILFLLFIKLFGIRSVDLTAGRTIFGLFAGGLLAIFANFYVNEMVKKSFQENESEMNVQNLENNYKKHIKIISGFAFKSAMMLFTALVVVPFLVLWTLGMQSFIAVVVGLVVAGSVLSFAIQENGCKNSEITEMIRVTLLLALILIPVLI